MKKRFSEEQIVGFLKEADAGMPVMIIFTDRLFFFLDSVASKCERALCHGSESYSARTTTS